MPGWLCDLLTSAGFAAVAGAALGGLAGYVGQRVLASQETNAKRAELFALPYQQLSSHSMTLPAFDPQRGRYLDPVDLRAINLLLDGKR